jgi:cysteine desulfurase
VRVYLDHNATTPLRREVRDVLLATLDRLRGNPSSVHASGREARQLLDEARERCAAALGVGEDELTFTSGGTESNNLALRGVLARRPRAGLVVPAGEHASVLGPARRLAEEGHPLELAPLDREGCVDARQVAVASRRVRAGLVSVAAANNEIGTLGPLAELGELLATGIGDSRPLLHTDAVQALGRIPLELAAWRVDLATFSAHKLGGPAGVGLLWRRRGAALEPSLAGGEQEGGLRPGTENVAGAVAAARAIELAIQEHATFAARLRELEGLLWSSLQAAVPDARLLGPPLGSERRLPGTLNVVLPDVEAKVLVARLDVEGLEASAGSACASGSLEPSHVLLAMGLSERDARAGLRLSLGRSTTCAEVRQAVDILVKVSAAPGARR